MTTSTPETDAAEVTAGIVGDVTAVGETWVNAKVARKLEILRNTAVYSMLRTVKERDAWMAKAQQFERERDEARNENIELSASHLRATKSRDFWKAKAERMCKWKSSNYYVATECGKQTVPPWLHDPKFGYVMCPFCGGRIMKEEK